MSEPAENFGALETELKAAVADFKTANDNVKKLAEDSAKILKDAGELKAETKKAIDEAIIKVVGLSAQIGAVEQKLFSRSQGPTYPDTPGHTFVNSEAFKAMGGSNGVERGRSYRVNVSQSSLMASGAMPMHAVISGLTSAGGGALLDPDRLPFVTPRLRRMTVRDLLAPGRTSGNAIRYAKESGFTNNAATVSETVQKPESNIVYTLVNGIVATIAHFIMASRQILDDVPALQSMIDSRLRYGLALVEEEQLLRGDGTGDDIHGILPQASAFNTNLITVSNKQRIDEIRMAILQVFMAEYPADGIVLHPTDWASIELTKDSTNNYIFTSPPNQTAKRLWGLPVVETQAMNDGYFLVGAFQLGAQIFDREDANVAVSTEDRDNFIKNMVTILAEERLALAVYRPEAFVTGLFSAGTT